MSGLKKEKENERNSVKRDSVSHCGLVVRRRQVKFCTRRGGGRRLEGEHTGEGDSLSAHAKAL